MYILAIKTDSPEAELALYEQDKQVDHITFSAHRELADKIHSEIKKLLDKNKLQLENLGGIIVFQGPGSFTGLRIVIAVANTLAYSLNIPIATAAHENYPNKALEYILSGKDSKQIEPFYGAEPNITIQKK